MSVRDSAPSLKGFRMKTIHQFLQLNNLLVKHDPGSTVSPSATGSLAHTSLAWARAR